MFPTPPAQPAKTSPLGQSTSSARLAPSLFSTTTSRLRIFPTRRRQARQTSLLLTIAALLKTSPFNSTSEPTQSQLTIRPTPTAAISLPPRQTRFPSPSRKPLQQLPSLAARALLLLAG